MAADSRCGSFAAFVLAGLLAGCERRAETFASPDAEVLAVEHPVRMPGPERPMPGDLAARLGPADASRLAEAGGLNAAGGAPVSGRVLLPAGAKAGGRTLFAIARTPGGGPPLAVRRTLPERFPAEFEIGPQDLMLPGRVFEGPLFITFRLDRDGDAATHAPDDLAASVDHPVEPGERGIEVTLVPEGEASSAPARVPASPESVGIDAIEGTLSLADDVVVPPGAVVFLIARSTSGGPPLAARKLAAGPFPMAFRIGPEDTMIAGRPFHGPVQLSARIDEDGDAISRGARDSAGEAAAPIQPGATGVEILLHPGSPR